MHEETVRRGAVGLYCKRMVLGAVFGPRREHFAAGHVAAEQLGGAREGGKSEVMA